MFLMSGKEQPVTRQYFLNLAKLQLKLIKRRIVLDIENNMIHIIFV